MTSNCPSSDAPTAMRNVLFVVSPIKKTDLFIDRHDSALNMSKKTKQVKVIVVSRGVIMLSCIWRGVVTISGQGCNYIPLSKRSTESLTQ